MKIITISVLKNSHANCDSLPLRFGMHFNTDRKLEIEVLNELGRDPAYADRFHVEANFRESKTLVAIVHKGHFVLAQRFKEEYPTLVTVWRGDRDGTAHQQRDELGGGAGPVHRLRAVRGWWIAHR